MDTLCGRIPRKEVELVAKTVMKELEMIQPGCSHTISGGCVWSVAARVEDSLLTIHL